MKSIVIPEPGRVEIRELPMVQKKKGEAVLKLLYGGVCGSDLGTFRGANVYAAYPCTPFSQVALPPNSFFMRIVPAGDLIYLPFTARLTVEGCTFISSASAHMVMGTSFPFPEKYASCLARSAFAIAIMVSRRCSTLCKIKRHRSRFFLKYPESSGSAEPRISCR